MLVVIHHCATLFCSLTVSLHPLFDLLALRLKGGAVPAATVLLIAWVLRSEQYRYYLYQAACLCMSAI